jgi:hypothetical protein
MNIFNNLENSAFYFPNRTALSEPGREASYSELMKKGFNGRYAVVLTVISVSYEKGLDNVLTL